MTATLPIFTLLAAIVSVAFGLALIPRRLSVVLAATRANPAAEAAVIAMARAEISFPDAAQGLRQHYGVAVRQISLSPAAAEQSVQKYRIESHRPDFGPGWQQAGRTALQQLQRAQEKPAC